MQRQLDHAAEGLTCAIILLVSASGAIGLVIVLMAWLILELERWL